MTIGMGGIFMKFSRLEEMRSIYIYVFRQWYFREMLGQGKIDVNKQEGEKILYRQYCDRIAGSGLDELIDREGGGGETT